jgi:hypothetical protein
VSQCVTLPEYFFKTHSFIIVHVVACEIEVHQLPTVSQPSFKDSCSTFTEGMLEVPVSEAWELCQSYGKSLCVMSLQPESVWYLCYP